MNHEERIARLTDRYRRYDEHKHRRDRIGRYAPKLAPFNPVGSTNSDIILDWHEPDYSTPVDLVRRRFTAPRGTGHQTATALKEAALAQESVFNPHLINTFRRRMRGANGALEEIRQQVVHLVHDADEQASHLFALRATLLHEMNEIDIDPKGDRSKADRLAERVSGLTDEIHSARKQQIAAREQTAYALHQLIKTPDPTVVRGVGMSSLPLHAKQSAMSAIRWLSPILSHRSVTMESDASGEGWAFEVNPTWETRSFTKNELSPSGRLQLWLSPDATPKMAVHEIGHLLEFSSPVTSTMATGFLYHRIGDEHPEHMGESFQEDEVGWKDEFAKLFDTSDRYAGKYYPDATEIVSMGLQLLYDNPYRFAAVDPEYFKLIVGILRGEFEHEFK